MFDLVSAGTATLTTVPISKIFTARYSLYCRMDRSFVGLKLIFVDAFPEKIWKLRLLRRVELQRLHMRGKRLKIWIQKCWVISLKIHRVFRRNPGILTQCLISIQACQSRWSNSTCHIAPHEGGFRLLVGVVLLWYAHHLTHHQLHVLHYCLL